MNHYVFRPKPFSTVFAVAGVAILLVLGTWQMLRFFEKSKAEDAWTERRTSPPVEIDSTADLPEDVEQRPAKVTGELDQGRVAVVGYKRFVGQTGCWLVSPVTLSDGTELLAVRGFVPVSAPPRCSTEHPTPPSDTYRALLHIPDANHADLAGRAQPSADVTYWSSIDAAGIYEMMNIPAPERGNVIAVLHKDHTGNKFPAASFEHVTAPYLTSMRHLNYAATWYFSILLVALLWGYRSLDKVEAEPAS